MIVAPVRFTREWQAPNVTVVDALDHLSGFVARHEMSQVEGDPRQQPMSHEVTRAIFAGERHIKFGNVKEVSIAFEVGVEGRPGGAWIGAVVREIAAPWNLGFIPPRTKLTQGGLSGWKARKTCDAWLEDLDRELSRWARPLD